MSMLRIDEANTTVTIPLERYDELLDCETRLDVLSDMICNDKYLSSNKELLSALGTTEAYDLLLKLGEKK